MLSLILLLFLTGLALLLIIQPKTKFSNAILFSFLLGIGYHTFIFLLLAYCQIYYGKSLFLISSGIILLFCIGYSIYKHRKIEIKNDLKKIPIYYLIFVIYILVRFITISQSTLVNFNNWDELRVYQYICKEIFITHNVNYIYELFAPMTYFLGTITYEFCGLSLNNPRIFGGIFYVIMSVFIYSRLSEFKVNKHIAALLSMIFIISSAESFLYYITFYNNIYYATFLLIGMYLLFKTSLVVESKSNKILAYLFLIVACLIRRESIYHILATITLLWGYQWFKKKRNFKQLIQSALPFLGILVTWNVFSMLNKIEHNVKSSIVAKSIGEKLSERFNLEDFSSFFSSAFNSMFSTNKFYANYIIFLVALVVIIILIIKFCKKKQYNTTNEFAFFTVIQQFVYLGIVLLTSLFLFTEKEFLEAASFSRYMLMVTPIAFISFGILLFENTEKEKESKKHSYIKLNQYKTLFIIPAYNEENNIKKTVEAIQKYNKKHKTNYDIIVINDGSKDNTKQVLEENQIPHINLIHNLGIGGAVQTGYKYAKAKNYDIAIQFDGDGQHDIEYAKNLILPIVNGEADMVIGSRFIDSNQQNFRSTWIRRIGITIISSTIKLVTGKKIYDTTSGYRACNKEIINLFSEDYPTEYPEPITEVKLLKNGYIIQEVYAKMQERSTGKSSITRKIWGPIYYMFNVILSILIEGMVRVNDK